MAVLDEAGDKGGPGDDGAGADGGELEDELGWIGKVEFGVHVDEVVGEGGGDMVGEGSDDVSVDDSAE